MKCLILVLISIGNPPKILILVSCTEARWICSSDAECGKALEWYNLYCRAMFHGRKCTQRCKNSLNILQRQHKSNKLTQCKCQNNELFDQFECQTIKDNMKTLCFEPDIIEENEDNIDDIKEEINEIDSEEKPQKTSKGCSIQNYYFSYFAVILLIYTML